MIKWTMGMFTRKQYTKNSKVTQTATFSKQSPFTRICENDLKRCIIHARPVDGDVTL